MRSFERQLITEWRRLELPFEGQALVVAVSGGADSMSLLIALDELERVGKLRLRILAAHFNHRLRGEASDEDEAFVRELCATRGIELAIGHSKLSHSSDIEQNARNDRYDFLRQTAENVHAFAVATAHTMDDQAETFLLNLIRGSGTSGLSAIRTVRDLGDRCKLVRPLISWARRSATEAYCHEIGIEYRFDSMNEDEAFTRVRIRKVLLPLLRDFNPKIVERLADTARLLRENASETPEISPQTLSLADLRLLSESEFAAAVRGWLAAKRGDLRGIELKHIDAVRRLVNSRKSGKTVELPGFGLVTKSAGKLSFSKNNVEKTPPDN
jgi:tRNA(Ile)-lysidine synthase